MSNYEILKSEIRRAIKENGNQEITGDLLQAKLLEMIDTLGEGYTFMGVATPDSEPMSTDARVYYIANEVGIYSYYGGARVEDGEIALLVHNKDWQKMAIGGIVTDNKLRNELQANYKDKGELDKVLGYDTLERVNGYAYIGMVDDATESVTEIDEHSKVYYMVVSPIDYERLFGETTKAEGYTFAKSVQGKWVIEDLRLPFGVAKSLDTLVKSIGETNSNLSNLTNKVDGLIIQELGDDASKAVSQKVVTEEVSKLKSKDVEIDGKVAKSFDGVEYKDETRMLVFKNGERVLFELDTALFVNDLDPRMKRLKAENLGVGDMLFYDRLHSEYVIVKHNLVADVLDNYDTARYETNYDTYIGTFDGVAHFVAYKDAISQQTALFSDDVAATSCFYRIEIDNTKDGSITFSVANGNATITDAVVSWKAGDTMSDIASAFATNKKDYIYFAELADSKGVGVEVGGYGANTLTASDTVNCEVIDCSGFAFMRSQNPSAPAVGGLFNPNVAYTYLSKGRHNNFRGATAVSILGNGLVGANTVLLGNSGQNYSYRSGGNFARWKIWASTNGTAELKTDGVNGSANNSAGQVMSEAGFNANITSTASGDALKMYNYYNSLFSSQDDDYSAMRVKLEAMYGKMTTLYDAYLMIHMVDVSANTGILADIRNKGAYQSRIKGDCMNVNYNYVIIPAYPPEYNSQQFELANSEGFGKGRYYHPEVGDLGLMFRDDIMPIINENIAKVNGVQLNNSLYRGSSADYYGDYSWFFSGTGGCLGNLSRYSGIFRCRPVLALPLNN